MSRAELALAVPMAMGADMVMFSLLRFAPRNRSG